MKLYGGTGSRKPESGEADLSDTIKLSDLSEIEMGISDEDDFTKKFFPDKPRDSGIPKDKESIHKEDDMGNTAKSKNGKAATAVAERNTVKRNPETKRTKEEQEEIDTLIENYQKYKKRKRIAIIAVVLTLVVCGTLLYRAFVRPPDIAKGGGDDAPALTDGEGNPLPAGAAGEEPVNNNGDRKKGVYTFLLLGLDQLQANTDTIMIGRFDTISHKLNIISIPRDTCANVKYSVKKINSVYAQGGGIDALMKALSDMTGFNIDSYLMVDVDAFAALVDTLGGVYFDVPRDMNYDDPTQDLHIHFNAGYQQLKGSDAVKVVRWRENNDGTNYGDIQRIQTQQSFLMTVAKQCLSLNNILTKVNDYAAIFKKYVNTNLTTGNLAWYGKEFLKLKTEDIYFDKMPSKYNDSIKGFSYGTILVDDWVKMDNTYLNPYKNDITADKMNIITRDAKGNLYATQGSIAGGYDSFLDYDKYMASLGYGKKGSGKSSGSSGGGEDTPAVTVAPKESAEPVVTEAPKSTEEPKATETPKATEEPKATETPKVTEEPKATETPKVTEEPKATEVPKATEKPVPTSGTGTKS